MVQIKKQFIYNGYEYNKCKDLCKVKTSDVCDKLLNWSKNRPEDNYRVNEIMNKLRQTRVILGEIRVWKFRNQYFIYDGLHRYKASEKLYKQENIDLPINIIIFETLDEQLIIDEFIDINKSIPIPSLYIDDSNNTPFIQPIIREYQDNYPDFVKSTRSPQKPNFNRDIVVDVIHNIIKDRDDFTNIKLKNFLISINDIIKNNIESKIYNNKKPSDKCLEKCKNKNFYLFIYGVEYFKQLFEKKLYEYDNRNLIDLLL
jgi:hypothetical protein